MDESSFVDHRAKDSMYRRASHSSDLLDFRCYYMYVLCCIVYRWWGRVHLTQFTCYKRTFIGLAVCIRITCYWFLFWNFNILFARSLSLCLEKVFMVFDVKLKALFKWAEWTSMWFLLRTLIVSFFLFFFSMAFGNIRCRAVRLQV